MPSKSVVFYNDSNVFGGHEIMTARIIQSLVERGYKVHCLHHVAPLRDMLPADVTTTTLPFHSKTRSLRMAHGDGWQISHARRLMEQARPDLVVVSQGYAESGLRGLIAARKIQVPTVSYIPFGNNNAELNNRFAKPRDMICRLIYRVPNAYITISPYQARLLARFTRHSQAIHVIRNPVEFAPTALPDEVRYPVDGPLEIAVVGRIVFKQKNQGVLVPLMRALESRRQCRIHVIGDGPDRELLERQIEANDMGDKILLHGWMGKQELNRFLSNNTDLVLIPSIYEGLPLILLETLQLNKPFLISDLGLLDDYEVPDEWRFDPQDPEQIASRVIDMGTRFDRDTYQRLRAQVLDMHGIERFNDDVARVFDSLT